MHEGVVVEWVGKVKVYTNNHMGPNHTTGQRSHLWGLSMCLLGLFKISVISEASKVLHSNYLIFKGLVIRDQSILLLFSPIFICFLPIILIILLITN